MHKPWIALPCLALLAAAAAPAAEQRMYKCVDAKGKVYYTQLPPAQCIGRETLELNKSGTVIRRHTPPVVLSPEEQRAQEEARRKQLEEEEQAKEERRKNLALLNTYASAKDIDNARTRALREAQAAIADTEKRIRDAEKRRKELESEKEFYLKKPIPVKLKRAIANNEIEIRNQSGLLEVKRKEISTINARYDEDKRRYLELTSGKAGTAAQKK